MKAAVVTAGRRMAAVAGLALAAGLVCTPAQAAPGLPLVPIETDFDPGGPQVDVGSGGPIFDLGSGQGGIGGDFGSGEWQFPPTGSSSGSGDSGSSSGSGDSGSASGSGLPTGSAGSTGLSRSPRRAGMPRLRCSREVPRPGASCRWGWLAPAQVGGKPVAASG
ncbi:MAG TPA: hypothetical protein VK083_13550 [Nocardia sp.]|nr:hypothetical protein [Nocardia sp.]HLS77806.1 hypothetical protein [Nocardia sp.]